MKNLYESIDCPSCGARLVDDVDAKSEGWDYLIDNYAPVLYCKDCIETEKQPKEIS